MVHDQTVVGAIQELYVPVGTGIGFDFASGGVTGIEAVQVGSISTRAFPDRLHCSAMIVLGRSVAVAFIIEVFFLGTDLATHGDGICRLYDTEKHCPLDLSADKLLASGNFAIASEGVADREGDFAAVTFRSGM